MPLPRHPMPIPRLPNSILNIKLRQNVNGNSLTYSSRPGVLQNSDRKHEQSDINGEMAFQNYYTRWHFIISENNLAILAHRPKGARLPIKPNVFE